MPLHLQNIIGQEKAKKILCRSLAEDKIGHAYLFRGPDGVGKKSTALSFAAYLNCQNRKGDDFCGHCSSCRKFAAASHPDYLELLPTSGSLKIDQIRELKKKLTFPPFEARFRVVLIPDIHQTLSRKEVGNSLLKTLEEPPADTVLILTADESGSVLPTIMSRCQVIPFHSLPLQEISALLTAKQAMGLQEAVTLATVAGGSLGRAMMLADAGMLTLRREVVESLQTLHVNDGAVVETVMGLAGRVAELKEELNDFLDLLKSWVRDMLLLRLGGGLPLAMNQDLCHLYESVGDRWSVADLLGKLDCLELARKQLNHNCNKVSVCEILFWKLL